jgi:putative peptidoglycan lipid II flippase
MKRLSSALIQRFTGLHSDHKRIARGAAFVAAFIVVGKLIGAAKEIGVAWRYGMTGIVDAYQVATTIVFWLPNTLVSVLPIVLVPILVRSQTSHAAERRLFLNEMHGFVLLLGGALVVLSIGIGFTAIPYVAPGLSPGSYYMAWRFTAGMAPLAILALAIGVYTTRLVAREFQINTLLEAIPAATVLAFVLYLPLASDIRPLLWGTLAGVAVQGVLLSRLASKADGIPAGISFSWQSPHWSELASAMAVLSIGQFVMSFVGPLDQYTAAGFGDGAIAALSYANRVIALLVGIGAVAIARGALPVIASIHLSGDPRRAKEIALRWAWLMLAFGAALTGIAWVLAPWGIYILYERGAFSPHDTSLVTELFRWGVLQLPFYFAGLVLIQLLASQGRYAVISLFAASNLAVKFVLNFTLPEWMGISGINLATSAMLAWSATCLYFAVAHSPRTKT